MDIRNINKLIAPMETPAKSPVQRAIKADNTSDRDANGQMPYQEPEKKPKPPMTQEICDRAVAIISNLDHMIKAGLRAVSVYRNNRFFIEIYDSEEQLVRTLSEPDIWLIFEGRESNTGHLLHKVA